MTSCRVVLYHSWLTMHISCICKHFTRFKLFWWICCCSWQLRICWDVRAWSLLVNFVSQYFRTFSDPFFWFSSTSSSFWDIFLTGNTLILKIFKWFSVVYDRFDSLCTMQSDNTLSMDCMAPVHTVFRIRILKFSDLHTFLSSTCGCWEYGQKWHLLTSRWAPTVEHKVALGHNDKCCS